MPKTSPNYNVQLTTIKKQPYSNKVENENKKTNKHQRDCSTLASEVLTLNSKLN